LIRIRLRYVDEFTDRFGMVRRYFRRRHGAPRIALPGEPGSAEFRMAYEDALGGAAFAPALLQPELYDAKSRDITVASVANQSATPRANEPAVTMEEKHLSEAASAQADRAVEELELLRDETWRNARGSLAIASDPPIRSGAVFEMLSAETERFAQLEASIKAAKAKQAHARRVAELTGSAWDAHEAFKLKELREQQAEFRAEEAKVARTEAAALEREYLKELRLEKARKL
jgi:hypothetical protein